MYQNFDEKYVSINYDDGSSATVTQTTLAYWDQDYGKKVLTNDEQLNMYMKPIISPAIKYLMLDNMKKLVDAHAFIRASKDTDALDNIKYNFYTKRNVRYTIIFETEYNDINSNYLSSFEELYNKQVKLLEQKEVKDDFLDKTTTIERVSFDTETKSSNLNDFLKNINIENVHIDAESSYKEESKLEEKEKNHKIDYDEALAFMKGRLPKSKVIINEKNSDDEEKREVNTDSLGNILEDLDL